MDAAGYRLVCVSVGTPDQGVEFCNKVPFPQDLLYLDLDRNVYTELGLGYGVRATFLDPRSLFAIQERGGLSYVRKAFMNWTFMLYPEGRQDASLQVGGTFVFDDDKVVYAWADEGPPDVAPVDDVTQACCSK